RKLSSTWRGSRWLTTRHTCSWIRHYTRRKKIMNIVKPRVELIAHTTLACDGRSPVIEGHMSLDPDAGDVQQLVEFAGRACYQSWSKPNPKTARNKDYIARTLHGQKHWSIAEHATATFYITGVSRALT